jgi:ferredoxin
MSKKVVIVGSGAGGLTAARELVNNGFDVKIIEAGSYFSPLNRGFQIAYPLSRVGLLGSEKSITRFFPHMKTKRASKDLVVISGRTFGGSTTISCGNIARTDQGLKEIGLDLSSEFSELEYCIDPKPVPFSKWRPLTLKMYDAAQELNLNPMPTLKAVDLGKCVSCGLCELGCKTKAKWDIRNQIENQNIAKESILIKTTVESLKIMKNNQIELFARKGGNRLRIKCDICVLAAGGVGTAQILKKSGISVNNSLWIDIVATLGGISKKSNQLKELPMLWFIKNKDFIISPYIDVLSVWFHKPWRKVPMSDRVGMMVKISDSSNGIVSENGEISKEVTRKDLEKINNGLDIAKKIMLKAKVKGPFVRGMLNGGHLGGTVPLTKNDVSLMKPSHLPENLWIADLSLVPKSQGMSTILLASALALKVSRKIIQKNR